MGKNKLAEDLYITSQDSASLVTGGGTMYILPGGVAVQTVVNSQGNIVLLKNGAAEYALVASGGSLRALAGAQLRYTRVDQTGSFEVERGAEVYDTTVGYGGEIILQEGGVLQKNTICRSGSITLSGGALADDTDIRTSGKLSVKKDAAASNTIVRDDAVLAVCSGGSVCDLTVAHGGVVSFENGAVIKGVVDLKGSASFSGTPASENAAFRFNISEVSWSDGVLVNSIAACQTGTLAIQVSDQTQNRGRYAIASGAGKLSEGITLLVGNEQKGTLKSSGNKIQINKTIYYLSISNDILYLNVDYVHDVNDVRMNYNGKVTSRGKSMSGVTVGTGKVLDANWGGEVSNVTVNGGSLRLFDGALAKNATLNSGEMSAGRGFVETATVNGGYLTVTDSGIIRNITVKGGALIAKEKGMSYNNTVRKASIEARDNGCLSKTVLSSGAIMRTYAGGYAADTVISSGGTAFAENKGSIITAELKSKGVIAVSSGGYAENIIARKGAEVYISAGAKVADLVCSGTEIKLQIGINRETNVQYVSGGKSYDIRRGELTGVTAGANTYLEVSSGGVVRNLYTTGYVTPYGHGSGGAMQLHSGGKAFGVENHTSGQINVFSGGYLSKAFTDSEGEIYLKGGSANNLTAGSSGYIWIHSGSIAREILVNSNGGLTVSSGGSARDVQISGGHTIVEESNARIENVTIIQGGILQVCGAKASQVVISSGGLMLFSSEFKIMDGGYKQSLNGQGYDITVESAGSLVVQGTGSATGVVVNSGGNVQVSSGSEIIDLTVTGGYTGVFAGGVVCNGVFTGGECGLFDGAVHKGTLQIENGAVVSAFEGSTIDFTLTERSGKSGFLINDLSLVRGTPDYTITVKSSQSYGTYKLAGGADNFNGTITVNCGSARYGTLTVGKDLIYGRTVYSLDKVDGHLFLTIGGTADKAPVAIAGRAVPTSEDVTVKVNYSSGSILKQYKIGQEGAWQDYKGEFSVSENGTLFFRSQDASGREYKSELVISDIDRSAPGVPSSLSAAVTDYYNAELDWADAVDNMADNIRGYYVRYGSSENLTGTGEFVSASQFDLHSLTDGTWYYQVRSVDKADNLSQWSEVYSFEIESPLTVQMNSSKEGVSWSIIPEASGYTVHVSQDGFDHAVSFETTETGIDFFALPSGSYQWQLSEIGSGKLSVVENISAGESVEQPEKILSNGNGILDVFFADISGRWDPFCAALHVGNFNDWEGTGELVCLAGRNKISTLFAGSEDANILVLTDDANGDALFFDDMTSRESADQLARLEQIDEIRAGAGNDIVDMTSSRFAYWGGGVTIYGGEGDDIIWANNSGNILFGDVGNDRIIGGVGSDCIIGGSGNDALHGGGGEDLFCFGGDWGKDTIEQLSGGKVTLWFESGSLANWDEENRIYTDGKNQVTVTISCDIELKFGGEASDLPAGAFSGSAGGKIFEDKLA